jgi:hypothetical protein
MTRLENLRYLLSFMICLMERACVIAIRGYRAAILPTRLQRFLSGSDGLHIRGRPTVDDRGSVCACPGSCTHVATRFQAASQSTLCCSARWTRPVTTGWAATYWLAHGLTSTSRRDDRMCAPSNVGPRRRQSARRPHTPAAA